MARFDIFRLRSDGSLVLDCQADLLDQLATRLVVPLILQCDAPPPISRLNPILVVAGNEYVMMTQFAAAIELRELGPLVTSQVADDMRISNALDMLLTGI